MRSIFIIILRSHNIFRNLLFIYLSYLRQSDLPKENQEAIETRIKEFLKDSRKENCIVETKKNVIKLLGGSNEYILSLSTFVQLEQKSIGKGLVVSSDISPDIIKY